MTPRPLRTPLLVLALAVSSVVGVAMPARAAGSFRLLGLDKAA